MFQLIAKQHHCLKEALELASSHKVKYIDLHVNLSEFLFMLQLLLLLKHMMFWDSFYTSLF